MFKNCGVNMELYKEIYFKIKDEKIGISDSEIRKIIECECYIALSKIRDIIRDPGYTKRNVLIKILYFPLAEK